MAPGGGCCCAGVETEANTDQFTGRKLCRGGKKKRQTSEQTWAHSSARNLISVPGEDGVGGWGRGEKKGKEKKNKNKHCFPVSGPDGTQCGAGVKEPLGLRHREEDD